MNEVPNREAKDPVEKYFNIRPELPIELSKEFEESVMAKWHNKKMLYYPSWMWVVVMAVLTINTLAILGLWRSDQKKPSSRSNEIADQVEIAHIPLEDEYPFWTQNEMQ